MRTVFEVAEGTAGGACLPAVPIAPATVLTIPDIDKRVPVRFTETCQALYREFGKRLMELGYLEDESTKTLPTIIGEGWSRYVASLTDKSFTRLHFQVSVGEGDPYTYGDGLDDGQLGLYFWCDLTEAPVTIVKDRLESLRRRNPPLAWLVLSVLEDASTLLPIMTPDWFVQLVEHTQWMGDADESSVIAEYLAEDVNLDEINVLTRDELFKVLPHWANRACHAVSGSVRRKVIRCLLNDADAGLLALVDQIQDLIQSLTTERAFIRNHHTISSYSFAALLFFDDGNAGGLFYRILDDFYRNQSEGDSETYLLRIAFNPADSRQTEQTLRVMRAIFRLAEHLEDVLTIIGDPL
ncbi:MAG: PRTRC system protein F [Acidithiobacillus sp.]